MLEELPIITLTAKCHRKRPMTNAMEAGANDYIGQAARNVDKLLSRFAVFVMPR
jgi:DNA-binding response OmpR family regulator